MANLYMTNGATPIFSTNNKKYLMVRKAKIEEITKPKVRCSRLMLRDVEAISIDKKTNAPNIVGMPSRNENFDASFILRPSNSPAVIAVPDLDAPGISANI